MLRIGVVVETHPEDHSVDLVMVDDGRRMVGVQALTGVNTVRSGASGLPDVRPRGDKWDITEPADNEMIAVVGDVMGQSLVLGFLTPQVNQMLFADKERFVQRWPSDNYVAVDAEGNVEVYHPSGTYLRIAEDPAHDDLTGKDFDGKWAIDRNTGRRPHVMLQMAGGVAHLHITPEGEINVYAAQDVHLDVDGKIKSRAALWEHAGDVQVAGSITSSGDQVAGGISQINHTHPIPGGSSKGDTRKPS